MDSSEFQAVLDLLRNPWFFRAWTWQESFLAKEAIFYYGDKSWDRISLTWVCLSIHRLRQLTGGREYGTEYLTAMTMLTGERSMKRDLQSLGLKELLMLKRGRNCKYPSDSIYSLIGVAHKCPDIRVDYDLAFETVFARSTWQMMSQEGNLSMFRELKRDHSPPNLPSWTPDWRVEIENSRDHLSVSPSFRYRDTRSVD